MHSTSPLPATPSGRSPRLLRVLSAWCLLALVVGFAPHRTFAQARLIEKITAQGDELVIPYTKYVLPNGLTLVVHEDHSDPMVHVDVTYHVGSAREEIGKSGFAHFFEHMMFQGSDHVADEQHFKIITESGGTLNGTTNRDRTNYFETVPVNQIEKILWLEADRMGFLLDAVTQQKFEVQRETVKNERGQSYDNVPNGLVSEATIRALYPYGHPYSWSVIGFLEDLNRVNVDDLKNFFLRWYGPNNATLTIGGNVDPAKVVTLVEKYFGSIPRGPEVTPTRLPAPKLDADRYVTLVDNYARQPRLVVTLPSVPFFHPDEAALDCLAAILGNGKNSVLYQQLIKPQKALAAFVTNGGAELAGEFRFTVTPAPNVSLAETKRLLDAALATFERDGIRDDDIARFVGAVEASLIVGLDRLGFARGSPPGKIAQLARYQTFTGSPNGIGADLRRLTGVTKADVQRVYEHYVKGKPAVIVSVATKAKPDNIAAAANHTVDRTGYKATDHGYAGLKYTKPRDPFDRSQMPAAGPNPLVQVPPFWREDLPNGIRAIGAESREIPLVSLVVSLPGGRLLPSAQAKPGLAMLYAAMMNEDTQDRSAEQLQLELQKLGSSVAVNADVDDINLSVQSLKKNLPATLRIAEERLLRPKFTAEAFDRTKKRVLEGFKARKAEPVTVANDVAAKLHYGANSPLSLPAVGTEASVAKIELADVEAFHRESLGTKGGKLVTVGAITRAELLPQLAFLNKLPNRTTTLVAVPASPGVEKTRIYLVDVPKAAQTEFRVGHATGLKYDGTGEFYRVGLMNYALGGNFNSRLNLNLREDKGWTYGARSGFTGSKYAGIYEFSAAIRADATDGALKEVMKELTSYAQQGLTEAELGFTKNGIGLRDARSYETQTQKAGFIRLMLDYDLPADYVQTQAKILSGLNPAEVNRLAAKWIKPEAMNIVLVGDKAKILPGLQKFGFEIVELDVNGDRLAATPTTPASQ